ncbi:MAG: glycosyltransferase family 2 protein [Rhodoferax sp.]|nr:glycosyltransferase family 2 protein [Rhodoferax sp.]
MLAVGAIFRDEYDYLLEWFAWHMVAGFKKFFIADNGSTDGTVAFLEALEDLGIVALIYQPIIVKRAQIVAYQRIAQLAMREAVESVLYIDADEFLIHESMSDGEEYRHLEKLLNDSSVGMVGINWRTFGSSGHTLQEQRPVIERFTDCADNNGSNPINGFLKSIHKIKYGVSINPHSAQVACGYKCVDCTGSEITNFVLLKDQKFIPVRHSGRTSTVVAGPLRINHYVIKSKQEFLEKKRRRGSAMKGVNFDRGEAFFAKHDFKSEKFNFPKLKLERLATEMGYLQTLLASSVLDKKLYGSLDISNSIEVKGWLVDKNKNSNDLYINIFVNDVWQERVPCGYFRSDLKEKNISATGISGFYYTHPKTLTPGDVVVVKVHANRYIFPRGGQSVVV